MDYLKLSLVLLLSFEFVSVINGNPIAGLFGKSDDKPDDKTASVDKSTANVATTLEPSSSCGGLKGFLHICGKTDTTEPSKTVKTRSVTENSDSDSDSDESSDANTNVAASSTESTGVKKRQADESEPSESTESDEPSEEGLIPSPEDVPLTKRQADESESSSESESDEDPSRKRRDCRDRPGDEWKDCKK